MATEIREVLEQYSAALTSGSAELMVGAGLSQGVGYPGWNDLLDQPRKMANVPAEIVDAPLVAEYVAHELGRSRLNSEILTPFEVKHAPGMSHKLLSQLAEFGLRSVWTTNYDTLLEQTFPNAYRVFHDNDYAKFRRVVRHGRLTKIHGSVGIDRNGITVWEEDPTITRSDYESYQQDHPLLWAELQARFLTNTFLFLGFSFNDPNIEVLLRLSRSLSQKFNRAPHYAIMKREEKESRKRLQDLRVNDLERAGILVAYISKFDEIELFLRDLRRRVIPPAMFVSGSNSDDSDERAYTRIAETIHARTPQLSLISMGSTPSYKLGRALANLRRESGVNNPEKIRFYYRMITEDMRAVPHPSDRVGTAVYTDYDRDDLFQHLLGRTTAFLCVGSGGNRSEEEFAMATDKRIPTFRIFLDSLDQIVTGFSSSRGQILVTTHHGQFDEWLRSAFAGTQADNPRPPTISE